MTTPPDNFDANSEWPIDEMPAMPLKKGRVIVRIAARERLLRPGTNSHNFKIQHFLAVQEASNKWKKQQSELKTEAAKRFRIRAMGLSALIGAFGGGATVTLIIEHLLLA